MSETDELKETIHDLSDEQLIEIVTFAAGDYRQEALDFAKAELKSRGVDWSNVKPEEAQPEESSESGAEEPAAVLPGSGVWFVAPSCAPAGSSPKRSRRSSLMTIRRSGSSRPGPASDVVTWL